MNGDTGPVLITGSTGFLGSWIIARLIEAGRPVVATDLTVDHGRLDQLVPRNGQSLVQWRRCDVSDSDAVHAVIAEYQPATIIHLAALQIPACRADPVACAHVNIIGQISVFEAAKRNGIDQIIYTSSIAAKPRGPANAPANLYGVFKRTDEEIARIYWEEHGIASLGLRPYIVYGVGRDEGETSAITKAIRAAAMGEPYTIPFRTSSCFQYAGEVAEIFYECTQSRWRDALLSDLTTNLESTEDVVAAIRSAVPDAAITVAETIRAAPTDGFDNAPLRRAIGDWKKTPLAKGVLKTINKFRDLKAH